MGRRFWDQVYLSRDWRRVQEEYILYNMKTSFAFFLLTLWTSRCFASCARYENKTCVANDTVVLRCPINCTPGDDVHWKKVGANGSIPVAVYSSKWTVLFTDFFSRFRAEDSGYGLRILNASVTDSGCYNCSCGNTSIPSGLVCVTVLDVLYANLSAAVNSDTVFLNCTVVSSLCATMVLTLPSSVNSYFTNVVSGGVITNAGYPWCTVTATLNATLPNTRENTAGICTFNVGGYAGVLTTDVTIFSGVTTVLVLIVICLALLWCLLTKLLYKLCRRMIYTKTYIVNDE